MSISPGDVVTLSQARAQLSDLADQAKAGAEKIITKNGESYVALIDAARLDYYHGLERERIHLLLIDEAARALDDVSAGTGRAPGDEAAPGALIGEPDLDDRLARNAMPVCFTIDGRLTVSLLRYKMDLFLRNTPWQPTLRCFMSGWMMTSRSRRPKRWRRWG